MNDQGKKRNAGLWVSILYFAEGFPYTVVNLMSVIFLKDLGASNELIGLSSFLYVPWMLKGLWGPVVDIYSTKRRWILTTEVVCTILFILLAFGALTTSVLAASITIFLLIAFTSATHDIAIDGFYLDALDKDQQAFFVGFRATTYKIAWLAGNGGLVFVAGYLAGKHVLGTNPDGTRIFQNLSFTFFNTPFSVHPLEFGWAVAFGLGALIFLCIYLFQLWYLPYPKPFVADRHDTSERHSFFDSFRTYFTQYRIGWIVTYVLIFRLGGLGVGL